MEVLWGFSGDVCIVADVQTDHFTAAGIDAVDGLLAFEADKIQQYHGKTRLFYHRSCLCNYNVYLTKQHR